MYNLRNLTHSIQIKKDNDTMRKSKYFLLVASAVLVFVALISGGCGGSGGGTVAITGETNENGTNENGGG